ncbi:MAG: amidohydrolase [Saprospiraceae bacterium]|nr:amidohydrolase [Saprospiraceae bacterium]
MKWNAHGHLLPYPGEIPRFMKERRLFWVEDDMSSMCQGDWRRPVTDPSFFLDAKLAWMDEQGIDVEVLLTLSQLYCNGYSRHDAFDVVRFQNDYHASIQQMHADRFVAGFVLQPLYLDDALQEMERCVNTLGLRVLCLPSHFLNQEGQWTAIADASTVPLFELANEYKLAVEIHPYNAEEIVALQDKFWRFHLIWMCAQTADAWHFFSLLDFPDRFPDVRTCFAHGNQFGIVGQGRRRKGFYGRPDLFVGAKDPANESSWKNVYFDSIVHDALSFEMLVRRVGAAQVVAGLDDPYPLGEMPDQFGCYPGKVIDDALESGVISEEELKSIWHSNVRSWLFGE